MNEDEIDPEISEYSQPRVRNFVAIENNEDEINPQPAQVEDVVAIENNEDEMNEVEINPQPQVEDDVSIENNEDEMPARNLATSTTSSWKRCCY
jgi:hypothetical protein